MSTFRAGDKRSERRARAAADIRARARHAAMRQLLAAPAGQEILLWILDQAGVYRSCISESHTARDVMLGERNLGLKLIAEMEAADLGGYLRLLKVRHEREVAEHAAAAAAKKAPAPDDEEEDEQVARKRAQDAGLPERARRATD